MSAAAHDLPEQLPPGERVLWQGAPDWRVLARRGFHIRKLSAYFGLIVAWVAASSLADGAPLADAALSVLRAAGLGAAAVGLVAAYAWLAARATAYTITDRRLVLRMGLVVPVTINLPFARVAGAASCGRRDGSGDVALSLVDGDCLAYFVLWPHARPWRFARAEPMLRGLRDVQPVAQLLARALAASADMAAPILQEGGEARAAVPHAPMAA